MMDVLVGVGSLLSSHNIKSFQEMPCMTSRQTKGEGKKKLSKKHFQIPKLESQVYFFQKQINSTPNKKCKKICFICLYSFIWKPNLFEIRDHPLFSWSG
jgi:hypothetical protein